MTKSIEQRKEEFDAWQDALRNKAIESPWPKPFNKIGNFLLRLSPGNFVPALRPLNDYGNREVGGYTGSVKGIDRIVKIMHDHRSGKTPYKNT